MTDLILTRAEAREGSLDLAKRFREFVASTTSLDSHGSIIKQNWRLERYQKNPIILWDHRRSVPIGKATVRMDGDALVVGITFATGDADAERVWNLVQQDVLRAVSVGFRPGDYEIKDVGDDDWVVIYDSPELYEVSVCSIGSNEDAVARAEAASDEVEKRIRTQLLEQRTSARARKESNMTIKADKTGASTEERGAGPETITRAEHDVLMRELQTANAKLATDLELERAANAKTAASVEKLEDARRETKLRALVGVKITEGELEEQREYLKENETRFDRAMKNRPDLGFHIGKRVAEADSTTKRATDGSDPAEDLARLDKRTAERIRDFGEDPFTAAVKAAGDLGLKS